MNKTTNSILKKVLEEIDVPKDELIKINKNLEVFIQHIKTTIKSLNLEAEIFVGGSFARKTLIRKGDYDIDLFIRFDKKHKDISGITEQLIKKSGLKEVSKIHGSRDYFRIKISENLFFEIIPVKKIKTPKEADNITDLSYSHVKYIKKKIKKEETLREIRLAKAFCYASRCYGAESYIKGFSGYSLELLIYHYKSFANFIRSMSRIKEKLIIDLEKYYKNKNTILLDLNASKIKSPIILVDPTYKTRNVLAALSDETFKRFQKYCADFLKNPSEEKFRLEKKDIKKIERQANKNDHEFIIIRATTNKQEGDVAGSKLLKFCNHLEKEISNLFEIKKKYFEYDGVKTGTLCIVVKEEKEVLLIGPKCEDQKNSEKFRKKHKSTFVKKERLYSKESINSTAKDFIKKWKSKNKKKLEEMSIEKLEILNKAT